MVQDARDIDRKAGVATVDTDTKRHLAAVEEDLAREFSTLSRDVVHSHVEKVSGGLLSQASFPDFVPLLTRRFAREELDRLAHTSVATGPS
jgi:hypothetical protein